MTAKLLISFDELNNLKSRDYIPFECIFCHNTFLKTKNDVKRWIKGTKKILFCSHKCQHDSYSKLNTTISSCKECGKPNIIRPNSWKRKCKFIFCSRHCSGKYWSSHKTTGNRRSKLEMWLETQLTIKYPTLQIDYNKINTVNAELDIYIPSLKLAFELNGIFHYEPIFGPDKLNSHKTNDTRKFQACLERNIELCIIDTTSQKYFKEKTSQKFLDIITNIVDKKSGAV